VAIRSEPTAVVLDTSVLAIYLRVQRGERTDAVSSQKRRQRDRRIAALVARKLAAGRAFLPSPVLTELLVGARSHKDRADIVLIHRNAKRAIPSRILTPTEEDWTLAGTVIHRRLGNVPPGPHIIDCLITITAARIHCPVVWTDNVEDFARWASELPRHGLPRVRAERPI
jgi:predicted nucleic acid-binding protein